MSQITSVPGAVGEARQIINDHLPEVARDMLIWQKTGLLPNGHLRRAGDCLAQSFPHDPLQVAEKLLFDAALETVAAQ